METQEPLDWGTDDIGDDQSDVNTDIASTAGISGLSISPAPSQLSKGKGKARGIHGGDDQDNNPDSYAYDDHGYRRSVFSLHSHTQSIDKKQ